VSGQDDAAEKEHEPTEAKLAEARRKGEIARSTDLNAAAAYGGLLLLGLAAGGGLLARAAGQGARMLAEADRMAAALFAAPQAPVAGGLAAGALALGPWFAVPAGAVLAAVLAQRALIFAPDKLAPKLSRISPISNAGQKFGPSGLFEFAKSAAKLVVIGAVLALFLLDRLEGMIAAAALPARAVVAVMGATVLGFLTLVVAVQAAVAAVDYLWQAYDHRRRNRMTRQEMLDELKSSEGDPHVKGQRRRRAEQIATSRMLRDVAGADVVVVNPTHYAVALKWRRGDRGAPVCVAKGVDEVAARIRAAALEAGVPVRADPPTARALYAAVAVGEQVRPEHYRAVAAAIRFAEAMRNRARARWGRGG